MTLHRSNPKELDITKVMISGTARTGVRAALFGLATIEIALAFALNLAAPDFASSSIDLVGDWDCSAPRSLGAFIAQR